VSGNGQQRAAENRGFDAIENMSSWDQRLQIPIATTLKTNFRFPWMYLNATCKWSAFGEGFVKKGRRESAAAMFVPPGRECYNFQEFTSPHFSPRARSSIGRATDS
jgi:hypothetical protein